MMSRRLMNIAGPGMKGKVVNMVFKNSWVQGRGAIEFAPRSFNKMWKERMKN
jgi:L-lactate dehydrogenase complex protein LldF